MMNDYRPTPQPGSPPRVTAVEGRPSADGRFPPPVPRRPTPKPFRPSR
jgi:hypothetical protein